MQAKAIVPAHPAMPINYPSLRDIGRYNLRLSQEQGFDFCNGKQALHRFGIF